MPFQIEKMIEGFFLPKMEECDLVLWFQQNAMPLPVKRWVWCAIDIISRFGAGRQYCRGLDDDFLPMQLGVVHKGRYIFFWDFLNPAPLPPCHKSRVHDEYRHWVVFKFIVFMFVVVAPIHFQCIVNTTLRLELGLKQISLYENTTLCLYSSCTLVLSSV